MKNPFKNSDDSQNIDEEKKEVNDESSNDIDAEAKEEVVNNDSELLDEKTEVEDNKPEEKEQSSEENVESDIWKSKYNELNNQYVRLAADFDNYRKRQEQEKESLLKYGAESTLKKMIEVLDNFDRGLKAIETVEDCDKLKECYSLAYKNFTDVLKKSGLETIKALDEEFDPNFHEAVMQTPTSEKPENTVIAELQKGYKLGDKVLRPTLVNVAVSE